MVSSAKKKRGKQRKAAKENKIPSDGVMFYDKEDGVMIHEEHKKQAVQFVRDCHGPITEMLSTHHVINLSLEQSGILSAVLHFLKLCEYNPFDAVVNTNNNGNLQSPANWIRVVLNAVKYEPSSSMLIAKNIGPLVRCMCNDTTRLFFRSNKHWREGIGSFVSLMYNMIVLNYITITDPKKSVIVDTLLQQHEGLLTSIVQWEFWEDQRADIAEELSVLNNNAKFDVCHNISVLGRSITTELIFHFHHRGHSKEQIQMIGSIPLVSKEYDSTCIVSSVAGFIRRIKTDRWDEEDEDALLIMMSNEDCIDKSVIREVIDLGLTFVDNHVNAEWILITTSGMVQQWLSFDQGCSKPDDTRVAFAIRSGLVEMCLNFIERFHEHEFFWEGEDSTSTSIFKRIKFISEHIHEVSLHNKTAKAIKSKKDTIMKALVHLDQNKSIATNIHWKELFDMVMSILDMNGSYCCRCNKSLSKTEVKLCNGCGCMVYCSRACQTEDWLHGRSVTCCKIFTNETAGQFQGRYIPNEVPENERAARKMKDLEINMNMVQLKLLLDNSEDILRQAEALDLPLYECVVCFDLCECPPTVVVEECGENFLNPEALKGFKKTRSKENITCDYYSYIINGELDEDGDVPRVNMQRLFPLKWLTKKKK